MPQWGAASCPAPSPSMPHLSCRSWWSPGTSAAVRGGPRLLQSEPVISSSVSQVICHVFLCPSSVLIYLLCLSCISSILFIVSMSMGHACLSVCVPDNHSFCPSVSFPTIAYILLILISISFSVQSPCASFRLSLSISVMFLCIPLSLSLSVHLSDS